MNALVALWVNNNDKPGNVVVPVQMMNAQVDPVLQFTHSLITEQVKLAQTDV